MSELESESVILLVPSRAAALCSMPLKAVAPSFPPHGLSKHMTDALLVPAGAVVGLASMPLKAVAPSFASCTWDGVKAALAMTEEEEYGVSAPRQLLVLQAPASASGARDQVLGDPVASLPSPPTISPECAVLL